ncbi:LIM zinc-binding domain-containing protein [Meloidogyne graminicola]|uniref:LIM zinc-binding domain-containing protein n=1 Tax=Meloidogyne graminicola TaxID=189291 RepID=A0A8S9ZUY5_9BILA|nr:LIM zinc-binding domain-containing protein [Meloidogyne graminicola]
MRWQQKRAVDTVEEVRELGKAALQQMAILEELEFEDLERKTKISDRFSSNKFSPISSTSSGSSFECYKNIVKSPLCPTITSNIPSVQKSLSQTKTANVTNNSTIIEINGKINEKIQNNYSPTQKNKLKENKQEYHLHPHQQNEGNLLLLNNFFLNKRKNYPFQYLIKTKICFKLAAILKNSRFFPKFFKILSNINY